VAAIAFVAVDAAYGDTRQFFEIGDDGTEDVAVIRVAVQRLGVQHELPALGHGDGGDNRDLAAKLVGGPGLLCRCTPPRKRAASRLWVRAGAAANLAVKGITNRLNPASQNARKTRLAPGFLAKSNTCSGQIIATYQSLPNSSRATSKPEVFKSFYCLQRRPPTPGSPQRRFLSHNGAPRGREAIRIKGCVARSPKATGAGAKVSISISVCVWSAPDAVESDTNISGAESQLVNDGAPDIARWGSDHREDHGRSRNDSKESAMIHLPSALHG
jgi:hypothetical protein